MELEQSRYLIYKGAIINITDLLQREY